MWYGGYYTNIVTTTITSDMDKLGAAATNVNKYFISE